MKKRLKKINPLILLLAKLFSSFCVAYVLCLVGQELMAYGTFAFVFLLLSIGSSFFYLIHPYKWPGFLLINVSLVALALFVNWYVSLAYSS